MKSKQYTLQQVLATSRHRRLAPDGGLTKLRTEPLVYESPGNPGAGPKSRLHQRIQTLMTSPTVPPRTMFQKIWDHHVVYHE
ncbi:MAG: hypothetical protein ACK6DC_03625, partial [Planctomycetota bacterium]